MEKFVNQVICGDCLEIMKGYDDNMPYYKYCEWQRECLNEMMRLLKDDGAIFYNHKVIYMIDKANRYGDVWEIKQDMHNFKSHTQ